MEMEEREFGAPNRLPGLPESHFLADARSGKDETLEWGDVFNQEHRYTHDVNMHGAMEKRLGMGHQ